MTDRELLERALDALEAAARTRRPELIKQAITSLRTAIAEAEKQEPVACRTLCELCVKRGYDFCANAAKTAPIITTPPAAQRQPVLEDIEQYRLQMAGISTAATGYWKEGDGIHSDYDTLALRDVAKLYAKYDALYKAAQRKEWQGLTDEEIKEIIGPWGDTPIKGYTRKLFDQIEAKLKEKNNG